MMMVLWPVVGPHTAAAAGHHSAGPPADLLAHWSEISNRKKRYSKIDSYCNGMK